MSNPISRQENLIAESRLVFERLRRVFFASAVCVLVLPILMLVNKFSNSEFAPVAKSMMIVFEIFSAVAVGMSYIGMANKEPHFAKMVYRLFWLLFETFSFVMIFANYLMGAGFSFYGILCVGIFLVSGLSLSEQKYYIVLLGVYSLFMSLNFKLNATEITNMLMLAGSMFALSRISYRNLVEKIKISEREKATRASSSNDNLTGLLNNSGFEKRAFEELGGCIRSHKRASILMIDIDDMGKYNDSFGMDRGDECIRTVAEVVKHVALRNTSTISRLDGGRFLLFVSGGNDMDPLDLAEKIRTNVERKRIPHGRRAENSFVTVSVGVASCMARSDRDYYELYDEAHEEMIEAKENGKNITIYNNLIYGQYKQSKVAY